MSMLAFMPWYAIDTQVTIAGYVFRRFVRGEQPFGTGTPQQSTVDKILEPYLTHLQKPITEATLVEYLGKSTFDDLDEDKRDELFVLSEIITFTGLSQRQFFGAHRSVCQENFSLIIQGFKPGDESSSAIHTRRRDGRDINFMTDDVFRVHCPFHVAINTSIQLDERVTEGLMKARNLDVWPAIEESIFWFNRANTDSPTVMPQSEIVMMIGAMERLFNLTGGNEKALAKAVTGLFTPAHPVDVSSCSRIPKDWRAKSVTEAWIKDLFRLRGNFGHGRKEATYHSRWKTHEHLLLSAHFYPLLMKLILNQNRLYPLSRTELSDVDSFESLACANLFEEDPITLERPWNRIRANALLLSVVTKVLNTQKHPKKQE